MAEAGSAYVDINPRMDGFQQQVAGGLGRTQGAFRSAFSNIARVVGGALAGAGIGRFVTDSIQKASDLNEAISKVGVVFGAQAPIIRRFAETAATSIGLTETAALDATGTLGNLFTSMGIGRQPAADLSQSLTTLASDLSSFNNVPFEDAFDALRSGLVGETEPLRRFGVNLNQAALEAKAAELGLVGLSGELTPAAKAQAAYALIMEQTTNAQGDFARTADGVANRQRIMSARFDELKTSIGQRLLPVWEGLLGVGERLMTAFTSLSPAGQNLILVLGGIAAAAAAMWAVLGGPVTLVVAGIAAVAGYWYTLYSRIEPVRRAVDATWQAILEGGRWVVQVVGEAAAQFREMLGTVDWQPVREAFDQLRTALVDAWAALEPFRPALLAIAGLFALVVAPLPSLVVLLSLAYTRSEGFRNVVDTVFRFLAEVVLPILVDNLRQMVAAVGVAVEVTQRWWAATRPVREALVAVAQVSFAALVTSVRITVTVIRELWAASAPLRSLLGLIGSIGWYVLRSAISIAASLVRTLWSVSQPARTVLAAIGSLAWGAIRSAVSAVTGLVRGLWNAAEPARSLLSTIGSFTLSALTSAVRTVRDAFNRISEVLDTIASKIRNLPSPSISLPDIPGIATGGPARGIALVGEEGPELVNFTRQAYVTPADLTARTLAGVAGATRSISLGGFTPRGGDGGVAGRPLVVQMVTPNGRVLAEEVVPEVRVMSRSSRGPVGL